MGETVSLDLLPNRDAGIWWSQPWGLVRGCTHASAGCNNCWLEAQSARFPWGEPHIKGGKWNGNVQPQPGQLNKPLGMKKPQVFAVWSDLFHKDVPFRGFIDRAFQIMEEWPQHVYVVLTKRPERMRKICEILPNVMARGAVLSNVILATSVEDQAAIDERLPYLYELHKAGWKTMLSYEPVLGPIALRDSMRARLWVGDDSFPSWVIAGGETGPKARDAKLNWFREMRDECLEAGVPFWLKHLNTQDGRVLDGVVHNGFPEIGNA